MKSSRFLLLSALVLAGASAARAACPADLNTIRQDIGQVRMAWAMGEMEDFLVHMDALSMDLACLNKLVTPDDALQLHVVHALEAWMARDEARVASALRGALAVDPSFEMGIDIAEEGGGFASLFMRVRDDGTGLHAPIERKLIVDGFGGIKAVPMERNAVVQVVDGGKLQSTWYVGPDGAPSALYGTPPYGWHDEGTLLVPVSREVAVLRALVKLCDQRLKAPRIAELLNANDAEHGNEPWTVEEVKKQIAAQKAGELPRYKKKRKKRKD